MKATLLTIVLFTLFTWWISVVIYDNTTESLRYEKMILRYLQKSECESKDSIHFSCVHCGWPNRLATADTAGLIRTKKKHK